MRAETSPLVLSDAFCSGFPAVTFNPQAPRIPAPDHTLVSLRHRNLTQVPEVIRALWGLEGRTVICMKGPSPSQGMKRGSSGVGTLCSAVGPQTAGCPDMSTMAWSPLLLTLFALCTGDWMGGTGDGPWEDSQALLPALTSGLPSHHLCLSSFQDPGPRLC